MTENMKKFLEAVSKNEELAKKVNTMTKEELIALAKELGVELMAADFEKPDGELNDDVLDAVAGGANCYCVLGGGGKADEGDDTCACVAFGIGMASENKKDARCSCPAAGFGIDY